MRCSAGILLFRRDGGSVEVLLGHMGGPLWARRDERAWTIPKGEYGTDEDAPTAARREFEEETGSPVPSGTVLPLGEVRQSGGKIVTAWAVEGDLDATGLHSNTFDLEWPPHSGRIQQFPELDRFAWFGPDVARAKIVGAQATFVDRLVEMLRATKH